MNLAALIADETGAEPQQIMFLRHSNEAITKLLRCGATVEEFNSLQGVGEVYDYFHEKKPHIAIVVVIVYDRVYGVYNVQGIETAGTSAELASPELRKFAPDWNVQCRKIELMAFNSVCIGLPVRGWERRGITPVQRYGGKFFHEIDVGPLDVQELKAAIELSFDERVVASCRDTSKARAIRLAKAERVPKRVLVTSYVFVRNPDVVAQVLDDAEGKCQRCENPAPFKRRSNGTPYLEVHHKRPLSQGGEDAVENAIALCANCHRKMHYG